MISKKTIQVVLFEDNSDLFRLRLEDHSVIDFFVVAESMYDKKLRKKTTFFTDTNEYQCLGNKVVYFNFNTSIPQNSELWETDFFNQIPTMLKSVCTNFEDLIFISNENEFVDYSKIPEIKLCLETNPILLKHIPLWWGKNYREDYCKFGTISLLFSHIFSSKKILESLYKEKNNEPSFTFSNFLECGWSLNGIYNEESDSEKFKNELLPYGNFGCRLSEYDIASPPKFFEKLPNFKSKYDTKEIKIIITEDYEILKYSVSISNSTHYKNINFTSLKPKISLYGEVGYQEFIKIYKFNECYRIIKKFSFGFNDSIQIINEGKNYNLDSSSIDSHTIYEIINPS